MTDSVTTVGFDLDDVLLDFNTTLQLFHNANYDTDYSWEQHTTYDLGELWGCEPEEVLRRVQEFYESDEHAGVTPIEGSVEGIKQLKDDFNLVIITSKPEGLRAITLKWLDKYFPGMFDEIHFTNHFLNTEFKRPKGEVCREYGVETFIDDALMHARNVAEENIPVLLLDSPWNQAEIDSLLITRVYSWEEIVEKLREEK